MELPIDVDELRRVLRAHGARFALVFGSHARDEAGPDSDLDLGVAGAGVPTWELAAALSADGVEVDVVDVDAAPESLRGRIAVDGVVVLDDAPEERVRWQAEWRKRWADEAPRRARFNRDFAAAHG